MNVNVGQVLERVVRRDRMGISELSRKLHVSRRTIYNWFDQKSLNPEIIWKVGTVIGHDFSIDLPESYIKAGNNLHEAFDFHNTENPKADANSVYFWMNKYIKLLEKYNEILSHVSENRKLTEQAMPRNVKRELSVVTYDE
ncbi:hypothetical protein [Pedobacter sandarakinus]|uniref:hypothetical protein n=1 Tax=Pedobacter sandarakinus TaxID=353156 RepID=UPI0022466E73|nr:hypothetical protein [Pedobacter sandarakinus]MCX2574316.1 hypothetical protein [Pedobacter sandarakinus]